ncbi:uncharacterized protein LOC129597597 [Paramacrobiotus metropolitanus]|uniref:uncharacterized protein LOC129597597 n=1 Tax=Paramacrobiotus metropolitanus TaxID=2943436 RepID=UPI002445E139|nr:uncharacterized protein LOC129597597 [Paramacrobiotus metropolitanus]
MYFSRAPQRSQNTHPSRSDDRREPRHSWNQSASNSTHQHRHNAPQHNQRSRGHFPRGGQHRGSNQRYHPYHERSNRPTENPRYHRPPDDGLGQYADRRRHEEQRAFTEQLLNIDPAPRAAAGWGHGQSRGWSQEQASGWGDSHMPSRAAILGDPRSYRRSAFDSSVRSAEEIRLSEIARSRQSNFDWSQPFPEALPMNPVNPPQNTGRGPDVAARMPPEPVDFVEEAWGLGVPDTENVPTSSKPAPAPKPFRQPCPSILATRNTVEEVPTRNEIIKRQAEKKPLVEHMLQRRRKETIAVSVPPPVAPTLTPASVAAPVVPAVEELPVPAVDVPTTKQRAVEEYESLTDLSKATLLPLALNRRFLSTLLKSFPSVAETIARYGTLIVSLGRFGQFLQSENALPASVEQFTHCKELLYDCEDLRTLFLRVACLRQGIASERHPINKYYTEVLRQNELTFVLFPMSDDARFLVCPPRTTNRVLHGLGRIDTDTATPISALVKKHKDIMRCWAEGTRKDSYSCSDMMMASVMRIPSVMRRIWMDNCDEPIRFCQAHLADFVGCKLCPGCYSTEEYSHSDTAEEAYEHSVIICCGRDNSGSFHVFHETCFDDKICPHCGNTEFTTLDTVAGDVNWTNLKIIGGQFSTNDAATLIAQERFELTSNLLDMDAAELVWQPRESPRIYPKKDMQETVEVIEKGRGWQRRRGHRIVYQRRFKSYPLFRFFCRKNGFTEALTRGSFKRVTQKFELHQKYNCTLHEKYHSALLAISEQNEECLCRPVCVSGTCRCENWMNSDCYFTEDGRLILNRSNPHLWIKECGETCRCDVRYCFNRRTQQPPKVELIQRSGEKGRYVITPHPIREGTFLCRLSGTLQEFSPPLPRKGVFIYPKFGIWPKRKKVDYRVGLDVDSMCFRQLQQVRRLNPDAQPNIVPMMVMECLTMLHTGLPPSLSFPAVAFFALRDIAAGEELIYDCDFRNVDYEPPLSDRARAVLEQTKPVSVMHDLFGWSETEEANEENREDIDLDSE